MLFPSKAEPQKRARCDHLQMNDSKASELDKVDQGVTGGKKSTSLIWKKVGPFLWPTFRHQPKNKLVLEKRDSLLRPIRTKEASNLLSIKINNISKKKLRCTNFWGMALARKRKSSWDAKWSETPNLRNFNESDGRKSSQFNELASRTSLEKLSV